eukprot:Amastigsp_a676327_4345.p3 type:complete len:327 gc:universal Amastigsp_a676327_4345:366-1346(+)
MPPMALSGQVISTRKMGSSRRGWAVSWHAYITRRAVGMICPPPRWMVSAWRTASMMSTRTPRMFSSQRTPSWVASWKPATTESLISLRYWTALETSTQRLGPVPSGPKAQILRLSTGSQLKLSARNLPRSLASWRGATSPFSMASGRPSSSGTASAKMRLCLLADLERQVRSERAVTVSRYETTGSETLISMPAWSSARSLRQISRWSSPAPATMCSPVASSEMQRTQGSDLERRLSPSTSLGRSEGFLGSTATRTTGDTENFMTLKLCATSEVVMVPVLRRNWSTPTRPTVLPQGTFSICSTPRPIMSTVRWMDLRKRSFFLPGW